jgi:hypothetical protein
MSIIDKINNYKNINLDITKKIDIIYSILVHENIECIFDMIYNICYFNKNNNFMIIIHSNVKIFKQLNLIKLPNYIIINDKPYDKNKYTYSILKGHIDNFIIIKNLCINFNLFYLLASNCMIVKQININYLQNNVSEITQFYSQKYEENNINDNRIEFTKNLELVELFKKYNISIKKEFHEGSYFSKNVFDAIIKFIHDNEIESKIKFEFVAEEILLASIENYLTNKITHRTCKFIETRLPRQKDIDNIINSKEYYTIKKVPRIINHRVRLLINKLYTI